MQRLLSPKKRKPATSPYSSLSYSEMNSLKGEYMTRFGKPPSGPRRSDKAWLRDQIDNADDIQRVYALRVECVHTHTCTQKE